MHRVYKIILNNQWLSMVIDMNQTNSKITKGLQLTFAVSRRKNKK